MTKPHEQALEEAKKRLDSGIKKIMEKRRQHSPLDEPQDLVSGTFDEVEFKRREKYDDE